MITCERNTYANTKVSGEGGGEGGPGTIAKIPLQHMEDCGDADIHLQPMEETHARAGGCPGEGCEPVGNTYCSRLLAVTCRPMQRGVHVGAGFLVGLVTWWKTHDGATCA
ncbi:hypothetical protein BTVI_105044 [Pitangus sulphuratus]|nr:hypothetical protein BTVI_105044 [Pitangus sulphuratus]